MQELPLLSHDLVKKLDEEYPLELPNPDDSERMVWIKVGQRRVVSHLVQLLKEAEETL